MLAEECTEEQTQLIHDEPLPAPNAALLKFFTLKFFTDMDIIGRGHVTCFCKVCVVGTVRRPCQTKN